MSENQPPAVGTITWHDLTVSDAEGVRNFYEKVVGWKSAAVDMGGYSDFNMMTPEGETVAGICHARGSNANIPPQWMIYFTVADTDAAARHCTENGGQVVDGPRDMGPYRFCVIQDPAGAVAGLISAKVDG